MLRFLETPVFTAQVTEALTDEEYRKVQSLLLANPGAGDLIRGSGGLRKMRVARSGRGKRGGARLIYYWYVPSKVIYLLLMYSKNERDDLTPRQLKILRTVVEAE